jgi:hypothetical protein
MLQRRGWIGLEAVEDYAYLARLWSFSGRIGEDADAIGRTRWTLQQELCSCTFWRP